jgi:hypothetical protein|tara:strand:- start:228 stop:704 length:477 start_codon:yes stop_codon:yes gene_type:complete
MNDDERLQLKKMITESECGDNTDNIRQIKHSSKIFKDIEIIENLKTAHPSMDENELSLLCIDSARFLYNNYSDIFHKVVKGEIDLQIMSHFLNTLKQVEDGKMDQHEGSVIIGKILKEMYVDSALRQGNKIDKKYADDKKPSYDGEKISWKQYKRLHS